MADNLTNLHPTLKRDIEYNGNLNRSAVQGAKFGLLLAMLHQDVLSRPALEKVAEPITEAELPSAYPRPSLAATEQSWQKMDTAADLMRQQRVADAILWQTMHPPPLSQFDDITRIPAEVVQNCDLQTQTHLIADKQKQQPETAVPVDETGLYDILQQLPAA